MSAGCSGCTLRWVSLKACHCGGAGCHETFTTVANFDRHRNGPKGTTGERRCHPPESVALVLDHRGFWMQPGADREWAA